MTTKIPLRQRIFAGILVFVGGTIASVGTLAVAIAGFTLSFDAIRDVGIAAHIRTDFAWLLPVSIDGAMLVATVTAVVMSRVGRKRNWYPWLVVAAGAAISILCNGLHATGDGKGLELLPWQRFSVSAIPAVMLALSVHLLVELVSMYADRPEFAKAVALPEMDLAPVAPAPGAFLPPVEAPQSPTDKISGPETPKPRAARPVTSSASRDGKRGPVVSTADRMELARKRVWEFHAKNGKPPTGAEMKAETLDGETRSDRWWREIISTEFPERKASNGKTVMATE